jgi:hypothetical protein
MNPWQQNFFALEFSVFQHFFCGEKFSRKKVHFSTEFYYKCFAKMYLQKNWPLGFSGSSVSMVFCYKTRKNVFLTGQQSWFIGEHPR